MKNSSWLDGLRWWCQGAGPVHDVMIHELVLGSWGSYEGQELVQRWWFCVCCKMGVFWELEDMASEVFEEYLCVIWRRHGDGITIGHYYEETCILPSLTYIFVLFDAFRSSRLWSSQHIWQDQRLSDDAQGHTAREDLANREHNKRRPSTLWELSMWIAPCCGIPKLLLLLHGSSSVTSVFSC